MHKKLFIIFLLAFAFNFIWEHLHSYLYAFYKSGQITQLVLARAALFDAVFITLLSIPFITLPYFKQRPRYAFFIGLIAAIGIEWYALGTGRWAYNNLMPIIPFIRTGVTPTLQLGVLAYGIYRYANTMRE